MTVKSVFVFNNVGFMEQLTIILNKIYISVNFSYFFSPHRNMETDKRPTVLVTHWDVPAEVIDFLKSE